MLKPKEIDNNSFNCESSNNSEETKKMEPRGVHDKNSFYTHSSSITAQDLLWKNRKSGID